MVCRRARLLRRADSNVCCNSHPSDDFIEVICATDGHAQNNVGISAGRRLIFDPIETQALVFSQAGLDSCCAEDKTCTGIMSVRRGTRVTLG
jgi:hypothetical protein